MVECRGEGLPRMQGKNILCLFASLFSGILGTFFALFFSVCFVICGEGLREMLWQASGRGRARNGWNKKRFYDRKSCSDTANWSWAPLSCLSTSRHRHRLQWRHSHFPPSLIFFGNNLQRITLPVSFQEFQYNRSSALVAGGPNWRCCNDCPYTMNGQHPADPPWVYLQQCQRGLGLLRQRH
jgi:hypothetical protein